jgi:hypothetical protein
MTEQKPVTYDQVQRAMQKGRHLQGAARAQFLNRAGAALSRLVHRIAKKGEDRRTYPAGEPDNEIVAYEPRSSFAKAA